MKANRIILILGGLLFTVALALLIHQCGHKANRAKTSAREGSRADSRTSARPRHEDGTASARLPSADSGRTLSPLPPHGIDPESWRQAAAMIDLLCSKNWIGNATGNLAATEKAEIEDMLGTLGANENTKTEVLGLLAAKDEARQRRIAEIAAAYKEHAEELAEGCALSFMEKKEALTPEQAARREELAQLRDSLPAQDARVWSDDSDFMASLRNQMSAEEAAGLDNYLENKKRKAANQHALDRVQELAAVVDLSSDQTAAVLDLYKQNPNLGEEEIGALLSDEQKAEYQKHGEHVMNLRSR